MVDVASLRFNVIFKKAFSQPDVFRQFVYDILGISIQVETVIQAYRYPEQFGMLILSMTYLLKTLKIESLLGSQSFLQRRLQNSVINTGAHKKKVQNAKRNRVFSSKLGFFLLSWVSVARFLSMSQHGKATQMMNTRDRWHNHPDAI